MSPRRESWNDATSEFFTQNIQPKRLEKRLCIQSCSQSAACCAVLPIPFVFHIQILNLVCKIGNRLSCAYGPHRSYRWIFFVCLLKSKNQIRHMSTTRTHINFLGMHLSRVSCEEFCHPKCGLFIFLIWIALKLPTTLICINSSLSNFHSL